MMKHLCTISMIAIFVGSGIQNSSADDPAEISVAEQRRDGNRRELEGAIKQLTAHLKELAKEAADLKKAGKPDRFDMTQKKIRETVEKLEQLKSRFRKSQPEREVRRKREVRREKVRRREREPRREKDRGLQTELSNAIERVTAQYNELQKKAEDLARTDKKDAQDLVRGQLREVGSHLERLHGQRNRQRAGRGERRERDVRRERSREREQRRERGERREEHPEIRAAANRLEHMQAAIGHLKEAGLTEIAQVAGERAEKLQAVIERSRRAAAERREAGEKEQHRERDRRPERDGAMSEIGQAIRQLTRELKELREEVNALKKNIDRREPK